MKKLLLIGAAFAVLLAPAIAAGKPVRVHKRVRPVVVAAPVYSWTGFYVGGNVGWGWSHVTASENNPFGPDAIAQISPQSLGTDLNGGVFGGQIGYNWQTANWVIGIEGDFDGASINGVNQVIFLAGPLPGGGSHRGSPTDSWRERT